MEGWTRDISETGLSAFVAQGLTTGEVVTLEIPVPSSRWIKVPAKVARCLGTQYGFQFTALAAEQRAEIRHAVRERAELGAYELRGGGKTREQRHSESVSLLKQEAERKADAAFADRARTLIKRGYKPKVAIDLVLQELEIESGNNPATMQKARASAEDFLLKLSRGQI